VKTLIVKTKIKNYPIFIGKNILGKFYKYKKKYLKNSNKLLIISTKKIPKKYLNNLKKNLKNIYICILPDGEKIKENSYLVKITNFLSKNNFDRNDCIIALGGGVIGDLSGYAASIYKRGLKFVQIPTTLLSQVDSAVGGKTGINNTFGKNIIGTFYQPDFVFIDIDTLRTLPKREISAGFAEILKYSLILDKKFFNWLYINGVMILKNTNNNKNIILTAIYKSCMLKSKIIEKDEFENNYRAILNFGHTFAHAIETSTNYSKTIIHGEAVLIGMMLASRLSNNLGYLKNNDLEIIKNIYKKLKLNFKYKKFVTFKNIDSIFKIMLNDKKSFGGKIKIILLKKIGQSFIKETTLKKSFIPLIKKDIKNGNY
tara:strand:- start:738 stop:1850 length:1113 start_codon:yes stop_codon:yes gene_type:complete